MSEESAVDEPNKLKKKKKKKSKAKKVKAAASKAKAVTTEKATNAFDGVIEAIDNMGSDKNR